MYAFPSDFNFSALTGCVLETVCFAQFSIYMNYSQDTMISIMSAYSLDGAISELPVISSDIMKLVGKKIKNASKDEKNDLIVIFENGSSLIILNTDDHYECYSINLSGREIII